MRQEGNISKDPESFFDTSPEHQEHSQTHLGDSQAETTPLGKAKTPRNATDNSEGSVYTPLSNLVKLIVSTMNDLKIAEQPSMQSKRLSPGD